MANDGRQINVQITGQDELSPVLGKAGRQVEDFGVQAGTVGHVLERIEVAAVVAGLAAIGEHALEAGAHLSELAMQTGLSVEKLSDLQYTALTTGASSELLEQGLRKLASSLSLAAGGSQKQLELFNALGISVRNASGQIIPLDQALVKIAARFQQMPDGVNKLALATQLLGRQGSALIPMFHELAEQGLGGISAAAQKAGVELSTLDSNVLRGLNETLEVLKLKGEALAQQFLAGLAPAIERAAESLDLMVTRMGSAGKAGQFLGDVVKFLVTGFEGVVLAMETVLDKLELLFEAMAKASNRDFAGALASLRQALLIDEDPRFGALLDQYQAAQRALAGGPKSVGVATGGGEVVQRFNKESEALRKEKLKAQMEDIKLAAEFQKATDQEELSNTKTLYDAQLISAREYYDTKQRLATDELQVEISALQRQIDLQQKAMEKISKAAPDYERQRIAAAIEINKLTEQQSVLMEKLADLQGKNSVGANDALLQQAHAMQRNAFLAEDMGKKIAEVYAALATAEQALAFQVATHQISQMQSDEQANLLRDRAREKLQGMTADYKAFAQASGDPKLVQSANDLNLKLTELSHTLNTVRDAAFNAFENGFSTLFTDILTQSKSAGQAFLDFAKSIVAALDQVIAKMIAVWLFGKIIGMFAGSAPGGLQASNDAALGLSGPAAGVSLGSDGIGAAAPAFAPLASSTLFVPSSLGSVAASAASFSAGAAAPVVNYYVDARGAAPGVDQAIVRALAMTKDQSVREAVAKVRDIQLRR